MWTLDGVGNRKTEVVTRLSDQMITSNKTYSYSARDQLELMTDSANQLTVTYGYDQNGNRTTRTVTKQGQPAQTTTYTFDARDRMIGAQPNAPNTANAARVDYQYDADGRQIERIETPATGTAETTLYVYTGHALLHEADPSNTTDGLSISDTYRHSALLDRHIAMAAGGAMTLRHYQLDALNTPVAMTDGNGDTVTRTAFDAWGNIKEQTANGVTQAPWQMPAYNPDVTGQAQLLGNDGQSIGFTGYQKDAATGLYYAGARWYDPLVGNFNAADPWAGDNSAPITFDKYLYGRANPNSYIDPDGKVSFLSTAQEYLGGTLQSYETQMQRAIAEGNGALAFGLGIGKSLAGAGEMVVSGLNTTSNLIAQHQYDGDVYDQTQRELRANEAGAGEIIAGGHVLGQKVYDDPVGTAQQVGTSAADFADRLANRDPRAMGTAGEITGGLLIPAGGAGKKAIDEGIDIARIVARLDLDTSDIVRDLDEGFRPASAAHGMRIVEKPSGGVGAVENNKPQITVPYKRPSGSTTRAQRNAVQGKPCVKCGAETPRQIAGHKKAIVEEYYETGTIDKTRMRSLEAIQPECPTCSAREGAEMSRFSRMKREEYGL